MSNVNSVNIVKHVDVEAVYCAVLPISLMVFSKLNLHPMYMCSDLEFVKSFTPVRLQKNQFYPRKKRVNSGVLGQNLRMEDVFLIYIEHIVSFCAIIYSNTSFLQLCKLKSAKFTDRVIFCAISWKNVSRPKIFYTSVSCATSVSACATLWKKTLHLANVWDKEGGLRRQLQLQRLRLGELLFKLEHFCLGVNSLEICI